MNMGAPWDNSRFEDWGKKGTFIQYGAAWAQVSAGPFRMFKGFQSEGGIRAPMIIAGQRRARERQDLRCAHPRHGCAGDFPERRGRRLSRDLPRAIDCPAAGQVSRARSRPVAHLGSRAFGLAGLGVVRQPGDPTGQMEAPLAVLCPHGPGKWQLYDLKADPGETNDMSDARPKSGRNLLRRWTEYVTGE